MPTIGLITTSYPVSDADPSGRFVEEMARSLAARGNRVEVIAPEAREMVRRYSGDKRGEVAVYPAPYVRPRSLARLFYGAGVPDNLRMRPFLGALIPSAVASLYLTARRRVAGWDAVVSHWMQPSGLVAGLLPRPHLAIAHSGDIHLLEQLPLRRVVARRLLASADCLGFISRDLQTRFRRLVPPAQTEAFDRQARLTPMGTFVSPSPRKAGPRLSLLFVGRLVPVKGVDVLLRAVSGRTDCHLTIAGDGPERNRLEQLADNVGAPATFVGSVTPASRDLLLAACDAVVVPSLVLGSGRTEGLPLAVVEGMAAGRAVIASDVGGVGELVTHGLSGLLVPPGDASQLRAAIAKLAMDEPLIDQLGRAASDTGKSRRWDTLVESYLEVLGLPPSGDMS